MLTRNADDITLRHLDKAIVHGRRAFYFYDVDKDTLHAVADRLGDGDIALGMRNIFYANNSDPLGKSEQAKALREELIAAGYHPKPGFIAML